MDLSPLVLKKYQLSIQGAQRNLGYYLTYLTNNAILYHYKLGETLVKRTQHVDKLEVGKRGAIP